MPPSAAPSDVTARPTSARPNSARPKSATVLLTGRDRHLASRFSYGITPELARDVQRVGGGQQWFERQLRPTAIKDSAANRTASWFPSLRRSPAQLWERQITGVEGGWEVMQDYARWVLMRRLTSRRQLLEVMTEFWENHLHVGVDGDAQFTHRISYGATIRKHALGRFDTMLTDTTTHPAMLIYLSAAFSTKEHPNENLGRELLELHTVGGGNYTERDVRDSARILTGWTVDAWKTWRPSYDKETHYRGKVKVKGFADDNRSANGKDVTRRYLHHLAHHPDTARQIATRLAVKFVGDDPSPQLVKHLARTYLAHDTEIVPVLRELIATKHFARAAGTKVRDPGEDLVASYRAIGADVRRPSDAAYDGSGLQALVWQAGSIGVSPFAWGRPDGQPIDDDSWSSPARILASMRVHNSLSYGYPRNAVRYRTAEKWLPRKEIRFDDLVTHVAAIVLHRDASPGLIKACSVATGVAKSETIDKEHDLVRWGFPRLLTTMLDSPTHLSR